MIGLRYLICRHSFVATISNSNKFRTCQLRTRRTLFTADSLQINMFLETRKNFLISFNNIEKFKTEMENKCKGDINYLIFYDDIKKMIKIAETDEDLVILVNMLKKLCRQTTILRFGSFSLGPEIMRLYYTLNKPVEGLYLIKSSDTSFIFTEVNSFLILGALLYKNEMYKEVIELVHMVLDRQLQHIKYPRNLIILYLASCYKLNTSESFDAAKKMWNEVEEFGLSHSERGTWFFSALSLKQKEPDLALKVLSKIKPSAIGYNIKIMAYSATNQCDKVKEFFIEVFFNDTPNSIKNKFVTSDCLKFVEEAFKHGEYQQLKTFEQLKQQLFAHNFVQEQCLNAFLCEEISYSPRGQKIKKQTII